MEAVITIDVLRRAGADVTVASVEKQLVVEACHGVKIVADALISDCHDTVYDLVSLPVRVNTNSVRIEPYGYLFTGLVIQFYLVINC